MQEGAIPARFDADGNVVEYGKPRETRIFDGRPFLMETALPGDVAILRAWKVDKAGNCVFRYTTKTFAPLMAKAAKLSIVEAENIVEVGEIDPNEVDLPGIFIDRIVPATVPSQAEIVKTRSAESKDSQGTGTSKPEALVRRDRIARRAAKELKHGYYVNLGVGKNPSRIVVEVVKHGSQRHVWLTVKFQVFQLWQHRSCLLANMCGCSPKTASWAWEITPCPKRLICKS